MRKYEVTQKDIDALLCGGDCVDFCEGSLLDNYVFYSDSYTGFIFEEYVNTNTSKNVLYIVPNTHKHVIANMWFRFSKLYV